MVDGDQYIQRVTSVLKQFEMARKAVNALKGDESRLIPVIKKRARKDLDGVVAILKKADMFRESRGAMPGEPPERRLPRDEDAIAKIINDFEENAKTEYIGEVEVACNRVNQNELIMLVALFEMQMKDIHREILLQDPTLLTSDRQVPLGKLISEGVDAVIQLEIEREVQSLDRKNAEERAAYFRGRLRLTWPDKPGPKTVRQVLEMRNKLLHEDADMIVTDQQLWEVREVALGLPYLFCIECSARYASGFRQWDGYMKLGSQLRESEGLLTD